jgi:hypothetical protein
MQVFGLPGHIIRNGRAASRLLAAQPQISKPREDATPWRAGVIRGPTASPPSRPPTPSASRRPTSIAGTNAPNLKAGVRTPSANPLGRPLRSSRSKDCAPTRIVANLLDLHRSGRCSVGGAHN